MGQHPNACFNTAVKTRRGNRGGMEEQTPPDQSHHRLPANDDGPGNENGPGTQEDQVTQQVPNSEGASDRNGEPTEEDNSGKRTRWSIEMNMYLYRTYLQITKMETDLNPYSNQLHKKMTERFPNELRGEKVQHHRPEKTTTY